MKSRMKTLAIAPFGLLSAGLVILIVSCTQQTQDLYKIEIERACHECDLRGINLSGETLGGKYRVPLSNSPLSTDPEGLNYAEPVDLTGSNLEGANLSRADLSEVVFNQTNLSSANLSEANLTDAQLIGADLQQADLQGAILENADLSRADLRGADLQDAKLSGANFTDARLDEATRRLIESARQ